MDHFDHLLKKYLDRSASVDELNELIRLTGLNELEIKARIAELAAADPVEHSAESFSAQIKIQQALQAEFSKRKVVPMYPVIWYAAAALVIVGLAGLWLYNASLKIQNSQDRQISKVKPLDSIPTTEPKPILRLADGTKIVLTDTNKPIPIQGTANVQNQKGQLSYQETSPFGGGKGKVNEKEIVQVVYNEVITPKGGQYNLTLSDGSKVWLNAASSIKYPVSFTGDKREVVLTGEAYFEIAHNAEKPFHVTTASGMDVRVLGTHFNVKAYGDEEVISTTLLEGSVKVTTATQQELMLVPGQQAQVSKTNDVTLEANADVNSIMAWHNNKFIFKNAGIHDIMRELARWYDLEVTYDGEIDELFVLTIQRDETIDLVLEMLQFAGGVRFKIEGKKVTVSSE